MVIITNKIHRYSIIYCLIMISLMLVIVKCESAAPAAEAAGAQNIPQPEEPNKNLPAGYDFNIEVESE